MSEENSDYLIKNILNDFKNVIKSKNDAFALVLRLKQSLEFNATIDWHKVYEDISLVYKDPKPYYQSGEYVPDPIDPNTMSDNDIFVFGSNTQGNHAGGAAKAAEALYGAVMGQPKGLQGQSYGIVTIDYAGDSVNLQTIEQEIKDLFKFAIDNQHLKFWVTKIGCGISNYEISEIAKLFKFKIVPPNVILPEEFINITSYEKYLQDPANETFYQILGPNKVLSVKIKQGSMFIVEKEMNLSLLGNIMTCTKDEFINATETVLKTLYNEK